ncbi:uncharacterized protein N7479_002776 [Penicillium vulpinum]|uniref:DEUBAD domain-containing protein n=1 Tax=Penicillium vulpinum TaxID=29845 RepID=A0A1V6RTD5_9EURO|nr:uncharacterized protein N7479_002776 [Penicillium vulpinum]KAJ5972858.1 hypothetical protein N7479_002776 [Penicillium vulpinum]OQE05035.1 hypothetical protein PENVUL_c027G02941 [Penicillium vulpinum]
MAPRKRGTKAVAKSRVAETRRSGRAAASSANVAEQSGLAMSTQKSEASSRARTPRRPAVRGKWSEEQLLTSDKSLLIDFDLVKLLARPEAWNCLEESDKREILDLLPPEVHPEAQATSDDPDAKIRPIPDSFIRYSNNWRDGVRQFQLDLQNGRYDPEWLHQAQEARQERKNGDFDDFKEREYEQFWGQKQKSIWRALAGESARVKMGTLIDEGVIQLGDIWKFYYVYGRGSGRIVIEKEVRVHDRDGVKLTFAIPPGERVFLRSNFDKIEPISTPKKGKEDVKINLDTEPHPVTSSWNDKQLKDEGPKSQITNATSNNEEMKFDADQVPQQTLTSSNDEEMKIENGGAPDGILVSFTDEMNIDTNTATQLVITPSNDEEGQQETPFSVVIFSPDGTRNQKPKRTIPEPKPQPPVKRKRVGRPRKNPPKQPEPEPPQEPEVSQETDVSQHDEQNQTPTPSFMSILNAKIEENCRAAAESSQTEHCQPDSLLSVLPSTPKSPKLHAPELSTSVEESSIANTNGKNDKAELLDLSTAQSDTPMPSVEAPVEAPAEAEQDEVNKPTTTEQHKVPVPTPSQLTASEPDEIIVPNISSPQALVVKILQIDGRMPNGRTANAWKEIRCYRNNQDMGSLFDVREAWFLQHGRLE